MKNNTCYLCNNSDLEFVHDKTRDNSNLKVLKCKRCGLVFLSSFDHISNKFYEESGMQDNEKIDFKKWQEKTFIDDARRYEFLKEQITNKKVLDFGCGNGGFLEQTMQVTSKAQGIELDTKSREYLNNIGIKTTRELSELDEKFDFITMFHVIEHLNEPMKFLKEFKQYLKPDGELIIETPNANDALLSVYNSNDFANFTYWSLHLILYTSETLIRLLEKSGYKIKWETQIQRYPISNHFGWLSRSEPLGFCENNEFTIFNDEKLNYEYERVLRENRMCDTLLISAIPK